MLKRLVLPLTALAGPALLALPLAGCVHHPHHYEREEYVTYEVETAPPPPVREEVIIERERPYPGAIWVRGYWQRDRDHRRWHWIRGHWQ